MEAARSKLIDTGRNNLERLRSPWCDPSLWFTPVTSFAQLTCFFLRRVVDHLVMVGQAVVVENVLHAGIASVPAHGPVKNMDFFRQRSWR